MSSPLTEKSNCYINFITSSYWTPIAIVSRASLKISSLSNERVNSSIHSSFSKLVTPLHEISQFPSTFQFPAWWCRTYPHYTSVLWRSAPNFDISNSPPWGLISLSIKLWLRTRCAWHINKLCLLNVSLSSRQPLQCLPSWLELTITAKPGRCYFMGTLNYSRLLL